MVAYWRARSPDVGVTVRYRHGRRLVGDRTSKSRLHLIRIKESKFADDVAVYATSRDTFESTTREFVSAASKWGLTVSIAKTKGMVIGDHLASTDTLPLQLEADQIEIVSDFIYLGSNITRDGEVKDEVKCRIGKAARAFGCLQRPVFRNHHLSVETKRNVYRAVVLSVLLYGAETWAVKAESVRRLNNFHNRCVRTIMEVSNTNSGRSG